MGDFFAMSANKLSILTDLSDARIWYVAAPVKGATDLPAQLYHDHDDAIAMACRCLALCPARPPWSDPKRAGYHRLSLLKVERRAGRFRKEHSARPRSNSTTRPAKHTFSKGPPHMATVTVDSDLEAGKIPAQ